MKLMINPASWGCRLRRFNRVWRCLFLAGARAVFASWILFVVAGVSAAEPSGRTPAATNLMDLTIEQLLEIKVVGASKYAQPSSMAPASVSVVTADEIKQYGHRTLADVLRSVRGFNVTYDRNYQYLGVRGFGRPGDYNSRTLIMIDGHRINDSILDGGAIGTEFLVDVDLIERVEVIRGPGSSVYGNNAFFAVINVITRRGGGLRGAEISGAAASYDSYKGRFTYGNEFANGVELLFSGSWFDSRGHARLNYPQYAAINNGRAQGVDDDQFQSGYLSLAWRDFSLQGGYVSREKGIPTGAFGTVFNDSRSRTVDRHGFLDLKLDHEFENETRFMARVYYDRTEQGGDFLTDYPPVTLNRDVSRGDRVGTEVQLTRTFFDRLTLSAGGEYRDSLRRSQRNFDEAPFVSKLDVNTPSRDVGIYLQGEYELFTGLRLNAGSRFDYTQRYGNNLSPRAGVIWTPRAGSNVKLLYGEAFRAPNAYEQYYNDGGFSQRASLPLRPETIRTYEVAWEQRLNEHLSLNTSGFLYHINDLISQVETAPASGVTTFRNLQQVQSKGLGLELNGQWSGGLRGRASYEMVHTEDLSGGMPLSNSPRHQAKLNLTVPLLREKIYAGLELQYTARRSTLMGTTVGDFWLANATLFSRQLVKDVELSASVYNLFNQRYSDPVSGNFLQDAIQQDGRSFRVKLTYHF